MGKDEVFMSDKEVSWLVAFFVEEFLSSFPVQSVSIFGGIVREPDNVHSDVDVLIEVSDFPEPEDLEAISSKWRYRAEVTPEFSLLDCFFLKGDTVMAFRFDSNAVAEFKVTSKPGGGGLDDDDTDIYIGDRAYIWRK